ncbi:MAG: hypothetical protein Q9166_003853 [cf. Caloplaca sp. 2 TL-2023]
MAAFEHVESELESDDIPQRFPKRRKLSREASSKDSTNDDVVSQDASSTLQSPHRDKENDDSEASKAKKPKYRIHFPSNPRMPDDTFLTQPPSRSSSPYRIDRFCWQKPRRPESPKTSVSKAQIPISALDTQRQRNALASLPSGANNAARQGTTSAHYTSSAVTVATSSRLLSHEQGRASKTGTEAVESSSVNRDGDFDDMLGDLPSDAFSSPEPPTRDQLNDPVTVSSQDMDPQMWSSQLQHNARLVAPLAKLRQTTLFGTQAQETDTRSQPTRKHKWPLVNKAEPPTHHKLDRKAMETWTYPTNLGKTREYQYGIVASGLYHNMLVALPTGLGKTFIAATIMLNWFHWTVDAQIVFVAPTKPLVSQQVKACFEIVGIPRSATAMLTGATPPGIRAEEWRSKRVFFMTPQTIVNDLKTGICDPKRLVLLVVDEAHRATGGYAYVEVVQFLRRFNSSFRVLALTATPGSSIEGVQEVIDGLGISRIEIRTEESIDIREYVYSRKVETVLFESSDEMVMVMDLFAKALQPLVDKLCGMNAYWGRDPMTLTSYGCTQARTRWMSSDAGRKASFAIKGMVNMIFSLLASLAHGIELLKFHGIGPFYHKALAFRDAVDDAGGKVSKYRKQINDAEAFRTMMSRVQVWINNPDFIGHPKLEYLQRVVMNHFLDAGEGRGASAPSSTRIIVFTHYRDSAEEIARVLKRNEPMVRPRVFVGQANSKGSEGMDQKTQLDVIQKFQSGIYNTLVATSIGEEGLDIGEVDLIVCYDASASPIRMLQRMGRTGRKRAGNIVVTLMKGKEETNFAKAKDNYEKMQREIAAGTRFDYRYDQSHRIVPKEIQPVVDKRIIEIPIENTQADLPEPKKRAKAPKRPPKKFHMPDGVRTGFVTASRVGEPDASEESDIAGHSQLRYQEVSPEPLPPLDEVLLGRIEQRELDRQYLDVKGDFPRFVETPRVDAFPALQRDYRPIKHVPHGSITKRVVQTLGSMHSSAAGAGKDFEKYLHPDDRRRGLLQVEERALFFNSPSVSQIDVHESIDPPTEEIAARSTAACTERFISSPDQALPDLEDPVQVARSRRPNDTDVDSPLRSLSPLAKPDKTFYQPTRTGRNAPDSEEDLPDFGTLIRKPSPASLAVGVAKTKPVALPQSRKRRKNVVDDDSDDE